MPTYSITHAQRTDGYAVLTTLEGTDIGTGQVVDVDDLPAGFAFTGAQVVLAVPVYLLVGVDVAGDFIYDTDQIIPNQLLFQSAGDDWARSGVDPFGTLEWTQVCTWIIDADVIAWLGIASATANDEAFITTATAAANAFAYRRRRESGYFDDPTTSPGADVSLGTIMLAGTLYRERGSVDSFASFEGMGNPVPYGSMGQINRLLGVGRSQVA